MIKHHVVYYLGSKLTAAALNLLAMALFVRMAGPEAYGAYIVTFAWAAIAYGFTLQWLRFAFFASYRDDDVAALVATYLRALAGGFVVVVAVAIAAVGLGLLRQDLALGVIALTFGLGLYDAFHEIARTRLQARAVAIGVLARAVLMLTLGVTALKTVGTPLALAIAIAAAHTGAAIPLIAAAKAELGGRWSKAALARIWMFGRPLIPAFSLDAWGLQLDRLILARSAGLAEVGPYGAVSDFVRQTMVVVSEAIAGAYIAIARSDATAGRQQAAATVLGQAFCAYTALAAFGAAVVLRFNRLILDTMFGTAIGALIEPILPVIVASNAAMIFRSYYFSQVLYLMPDSRQLLVSNAYHAATVAVTALLLVPKFGMLGAAVALLLGHVAGCISFIKAWRHHYVLQLPYRKAMVIAGLALAAYATTGALVLSGWMPLLIIILNIFIFAAAMALAGWLYNLLSFNDVVARGWQLIRARI
jgi:O-antigen/teichoic acid export membrane protein